MAYAYKKGPYRYEAEGDCQAKVFTSDDGGVRTFSVIVASAYDAGIIGSEYNGVAVLDEDNREVVFDRGGRSYDVPSQRQLAKELMAADWPAFCDLLKAQPRLRSNVVPDIGHAAPGYVYPMAAEDDWMLIEQTREGREDDPIVYQSQKRSEIIKELINHTMHAERYSPARLAWDIKVHSFDTDGKSADYPGNPRFDARWKKEVEADDQIFYEACSDATSMFRNDEYTTYPGDDQGDYKFEMEGRSGGWLVLDEVAGIGKLAWSSQTEMEDALLALDASQLTKLYRVVVNLDHDLTTAKIDREMAYQYSFRRKQLEEEWQEEAEDMPACLAALSDDQKRLVADQLSNNEDATDEELADYLVKTGGLSEEAAKAAIGYRDEVLEDPTFELFPEAVAAKP